MASVCHSHGWRWLYVVAGQVLVKDWLVVKKVALTASCRSVSIFF